MSTALAQNTSRRTFHLRRIIAAWRGTSKADASVRKESAGWGHTKEATEGA